MQALALRLGAGDIASERMRRFSLILTLTAWLLATGSHWDLVQTFAWGRMFVEYLQTDTIADALASTFDADKPCPLCKVVAKAKSKQASSDTAATSGMKKIVLIFQDLGDLSVFGSAAPSWTWSNVQPPFSDLPAPPTPPPRVGCA